MNHQEKNGGCSYPSNLSEDRYGVSWGEELPTKGTLLNEKKHYASFYLDGTKYRRFDTVYLKSADGPPYIARITQLYEIAKIKRKKMKVRWFCRPCELPEGLADVDYGENCKEIFMMKGDGALNLNGPASTIGHCTVLCTAEEEWNPDFPSIEEVAAADHIFDRSFDATTGKIGGLDAIVEDCGKVYVTGRRQQSAERNGASKRRELGAGKNSAGKGIHLDQRPAIRAVPAVPILNLDRERSEGPAVSGVPVRNCEERQCDRTESPNPTEGPTESFAPKSCPAPFQHGSQKPKEARPALSRAVEERMATQAAHASGKTANVKPVAKDGTFNAQKRPRVDSSDPLLTEQSKKKVLSKLPSAGVAEARAKPLREHSAPHADSTPRLDASTRERQMNVEKKINLSGYCKSLEVKKRSREDSLDLETEKGKLKKAKLSVSSQNLTAEVLKKVPKPRENGSTPMAISPKTSDLKAKRNLSVDGSSRSHAAHPNSAAKSTSSLKRGVDGTVAVKTSKSIPRGLVDKTAKPLPIEHRKSESELAEIRKNRAAAHDSTGPPSNADRKEQFEPKKKIFNFPWQASLQGSLEQRKALLLQNLDPWFSSNDIEDMLEELLQVSCAARMLPPKNFTCYTSGQALVQFRSQTAAVEALRTFTENWVFWSKDERPVLASMADAETSRSSCIHGFFNAEKFGPKVLTREEKKNVVATSHCSQPNTVEYEMGIQWRLLQERHTEAWRIAEQEHKRALDQLVCQSKRERK